MIDVKSTKGGSAPANPADRYVLKKQEQKSKLPFVIGLMLTGLAVYLKSIFPSLASVEQPKPGGEEGKNGLAPEKQLAQLDGATPSPMTTGSVGAQEDSLGSGRPLVEVPQRATFLTIDDPLLRDFFSPEPSVTVRPLEGGQPRAGFANDNHAVTSPPIQFPGPNPNGGNTPGGSNNPGGGDTDPDDDDGEGPGSEDPKDCSGQPGSPCDPDPLPQEPPCGCTPPIVAPPEEDEEDDCEVVPPGNNRAPRVNGPVYLMDVTGCAILVIGLADLLRGAFDPDGDVLSVQKLKVSGGFLQQVDDAWQFKAEPFFTGPVTITYEITDGIATVAQTASFAVIRSYIEGTDGDDILLGTTCADDIYGGDGDDNIYGRGGNDVINGGAGNDHIVAGAGNDTVFGGPGDDIIYGGAGNDHLSGGAGNDRIFGEDGEDIIFGDEGDDFLSGGNGDDIIFGGSGNDVIYGDAGNDVLYGEEGDDIIHGGAGNDVIHDGPGADKVYGGSGNDVVVAAIDGANDVYDGGSGWDFLSYSAAKTRIVVDLPADTATGAEIGEDTISNFEEIATGSGNDLVIDGAGSHTISTGAGDDIVVAAMDGADDIYDGGEGCDTLDYSAAEECLVIDLDAGTASGIEIGNDTITGFENVIAGSGDDHFILGSDGATLTGGAGENTFEFLPPEPEQTRQPVTFEITDFKVGDKIKMSQYKLFEKVFDEFEDQFEGIFGRKVDEDDFAVRTRHEIFEGVQRTVIEADFNRDDNYETTIYLQGRHVLIVFDHA